jgi:hypothetical protein
MPVLSELREEAYACVPNKPRTKFKVLMAKFVETLA